MSRSLLTKILTLLLCFTGASCFSQEIKVCLWKGCNPHENLPLFRNKYEGEFSIERCGEEFIVVNKLDIESYLVGVLAKEMDALWPVEALKAQAVVSRTLAIWKINENKSKNLPYDIENSIYHQVYGTTNSTKIENAVYSTKGEILTYNGAIVQVFFHANCGGKTAVSDEVWGGVYPYLKSVDDPYCADTPYYKWRKIFTKSQISRLMNIPDINEITVSERHKSGRVKNLKLVSKNGNVTYITSHKFRMQINSQASKIAFTEPFIIPGTNFEIHQEGNNVIFIGKGYGHGVGMCQWGARQMAQKGKNYREILHYYFEDLQLETLENVKNI